MKFLIFLGSVRTSTPPRPARLGERVAQACLGMLSDAYPEHDFELIDPLDYDQGAVFKPHFSYAKDKAPQVLDVLANKISLADGYVMVSPEYNHSMSPALANLLNHFGSSLFSFKPSAIVTYSAGQWGGMRAAVGMRSFLAELGCLPVSAMIHVPKAQEVFGETGQTLASVDSERWQDYFGRTFSQLLWWAQATCEQREKIDPFAQSAPFQKAPSERNAPK
ncbi:NADPH-dependent FMN reductase [Marinomonas fungiae]|uniref:NAD(P)H-dependent FMN reductase n=1 Tax=Marinomonas fungiae TaxID=1137284 RepID=A0A0K6IMW5_9GAMM|nr:NAD(P)H-dependent oxidoreductase [Marinomonas fungiae]CUB04627.1 NAD(P)H-dependent FMN reductase [Marinomonas fungiae]